jgi:hypothetical protein
MSEKREREQRQEGSPSPAQGAHVWSLCPPCPRRASFARDEAMPCCLLEGATAPMVTPWRRTGPAAQP